MTHFSFAQVRVQPHPIRVICPAALTFAPLALLVVPKEDVASDLQHAHRTRSRVGPPLLFSIREPLHTDTSSCSYEPILRESDLCARMVVRARVLDRKLLGQTGMAQRFSPVAGSLASPLRRCTAIAGGPARFLVIRSRSWLCPRNSSPFSASVRGQKQPAGPTSAKSSTAARPVVLRCAPSSLAFCKLSLVA
jgi:hypothetical protein